MTQLYSPHPRKFYTTADGIGPGSQVLTSTEWNLLSIFSRTLFSWDGMKIVPEDERDGEFAEATVAAVRASIDMYLGQYTLGQLVTMLNPMELLLVLGNDKQPIGHLPITKEWGGEKQVMLVAEARALTWLSVQPRKTEGKVVSLRALSPEQQNFINQINPWMNGEIKVD